MKIKDLKKIIEYLDDEIEVVISGYDHSYNQCRTELVKAEFYKAKLGMGIYAYYDEPSRSSKNSTIATVLWIG